MVNQGSPAVNLDLIEGGLMKALQINFRRHHVTPNWGFTNYAI